jgi:hypothetical protein
MKRGGRGRPSSDAGEAPAASYFCVGAAAFFAAGFLCSGQ